MYSISNILFFTDSPFEEVFVCMVVLTRICLSYLSLGWLFGPPSPLKFVTFLFQLSFFSVNRLKEQDRLVHPIKNVIRSVPPPVAGHIR